MYNLSFLHTLRNNQNSCLDFFKDYNNYIVIIYMILTWQLKNFFKDKQKSKQKIISIFLCIYFNRNIKLYLFNKYAEPCPLSSWCRELWRSASSSSAARPRNWWPNWCWMKSPLGPCRRFRWRQPSTRPFRQTKKYQSVS